MCFIICYHHRRHHIACFDFLFFFPDNLFADDALDADVGVAVFSSLLPSCLPADEDIADAVEGVDDIASANAFACAAVNFCGVLVFADVAVLLLLVVHR